MVGSAHYRAMYYTFLCGSFKPYATLGSLEKMLVHEHNCMGANNVDNNGFVMYRHMSQRQLLYVIHEIHFKSVENNRINSKSSKT